MQPVDEQFHSRLATIWGLLRRLAAPKLYCFVSYRRDDVGPMSLEIRTALKEKLFKDAFFDERSMEGGETWPRRIRAELARSDVVFVVIGPGWQTERLHDQADFVRGELVAAHRNRVIVAPLLVGVEELPPRNELPKELEFLHSQHTKTIPDDLADKNLWKLVEIAASGSAGKARRRKRIARLSLAGALVVTSAAVSLAPSTASACGTDDLDVGVAVRVDDRRSPSENTRNSPEPTSIADGAAEALRDDLQSTPGVEVSGPARCGRLKGFDESKSPEVLAADADLDVLVTADLIVSDQESQLGLFLTFNALAVPDAPEVSGSHLVSVSSGGKEISPGIVAQAFKDELSHVAALLNGTRLYASGRHREAADGFDLLRSELSGEADSSLLRVTGLLQANSVLLQARSLQETDQVAAAVLYDEALEIYTGVSELDGQSYGRAYLGIGEVWVERCRAELADVDGNLSSSVDPEGVDTGLAAFDSAGDVAPLDPATQVEVGLKSSLGRGNLALCGLLLSTDGARRVELADQAEQSFGATVEDAKAVERFDNLASEGSVGLAIVAVARCVRSAPDSTIEVARDNLELALPGAAPSQVADIQESIDLLDRARTEGVIELEGGGQLSAGLGALLVAACGLPSA